MPIALGMDVLELGCTVAAKGNVVLEVNVPVYLAKATPCDGNALVTQFAKHEATVIDVMMAKDRHESELRMRVGVIVEGLPRSRHAHEGFGCLGR
jgi:hypothetical protein